MEAVQKMKSKTVSEVVESCLETVREGWERTLTRALEWTLHPTEEDALSELARSELIFLTLISALSSLDAEMSSILLKEVDKWSLFPRLTKYMAGKLEGEWDLPREMLDRAAKFAVVLERSGMFTVPQELHRYLAQLLSGEEAGRSEDSPSHDQSKRPRKDPRSSRSDQGGESSVGGQASGGEPHQVRHYKLVARGRRSCKQGGRGQGKMGKQAPSHQEVRTSPPQKMGRSTIDTIPKASKAQTYTSPPRVDKPSTGAIPKVVRHQSPQRVHRSATWAIPKVRKVTRAEAQRQLWEGVERDDSLKIEEAILSGADFEEVKDYKMTPLTVAASEGRVETVRALLRFGARVERRGGFEQGTALHWASAGGHEAVVRELLAAGASVGAEDRYRYTPLHEASGGGHLTTARLLVEAGADLNVRTSGGNTPLALAVREGHTAVAVYLRSVGDITQPQK